MDQPRHFAFPTQLYHAEVPTLTEQEMLVLSACFFIAGIGTCFFAYKIPQTIIITVGGLLFGIFCWNEVVPQFVTDMYICLLTGYCVALVGIVVGGVVALLLSRVATGLSLGTLLGVGVLLADNGAFFVTEVSCAALFAVLMAVSLAVTFWREALGMLLLSSVLGGMLIAYGADLLLEGGLLLNTGVILQTNWPEGKHCYADCHMAELLELWLAASVVALLVQGHFSEALPLWRMLCSCCRGAGYRPLPTGTAAKEGSDYKSAAYQRTFTYPDNQAWNYFDPTRLPRGLEAHADGIYLKAEQLANFFGFQDDNVRNQAEHAMMLAANHERFADPMVLPARGRMVLPFESGVHSLHDKLFGNYRGWCESLSVSPQFAPLPAEMSEREEVNALLTDIMLWLCIWGEGSNLRHMPECICFLYHKMMQEYLTHRAGETTLYAGYFLDHVITPIWLVVERSQRVRGDHVRARNYDDFNEFFWSATVLGYSYRDAEEPTTAAGGAAGVPVGGNGGLRVGGKSKPVPVAKALETAPKTFLEKRSLLSTILTFHRVLEFHCMAFYLCGVASFAEMLVWDKAYTLQMLSSVFLLVNFLALCWCLLEVWQAFPGVQISGTARFGFLIRLATRFLILVYQALYFMWSVDTAGTKTGMQGEGDPQFWWWQYLWLSVIAMTPWTLEALMQPVPWLASYFATRKNEYFNAFMNIMYPLSRQYVGKTVHETFGHAVVYISFWATLLAWKIYFSYQYEVKILVLPSVELYDDYINFPDRSLAKTIMLVVMRWIPQAFIFLIDTSIWFAGWSAIAGSIVGFQDKLGEIRDIPGIRRAFMAIPEVFCERVICQGVSSRDPSMLDLEQHAARPSSNGPGTPGGAGTAALLTEASSLLRPGAGNPVRTYSQTRAAVGYQAEFLDVRTQKWAAFAAVWNDVITKMRDSDVLSNNERDMLKFHSFGGFSKPVYLPTFQTAGSVERACIIIASEAAAYAAEEDLAKRSELEKAMRRRLEADITLLQAVSEAWELGAWFLRELLGPMHDTDISRFEQIMNEYIASGSVMEHLDLRKLQAITVDATAIVEILHHGLRKRAKRGPAAATTSGGGNGAPWGSGAGAAKTVSNGSVGMTRSVSTSGLTSLSGREPVEPTTPGSAARRKHLKPRAAASTAPPDKTRDDVREKLRPLFHNMKSAVNTRLDERGTEVQDRLTFVLSLEQGFMWDDSYASTRLDRMAEDPKVMSILSKLRGLLAVQLNDAEPASPEARRRLAFFVNSLFMDMPRAPETSKMLSWTVMTPFYSEDVIYSRADLEKRNEDGLTTLMYLQALYKHDWRNFLERLNIDDEQQVWSKKVFQETRLWASLRAQTLSRTVEGMMYYEAALRLLANVEKVKEEQMDQLISQKFQYVIACQVYGRMKKNADPKADDIDRLLKRFPNLRVAYIDEMRVTRAGQSEFFSVLIKAPSKAPSSATVVVGGRDGGNPAELAAAPAPAGGSAAAASAQAIQEVFRVKLPGNPVIGEGKPENQNHAIIFTRGEAIQAIDMNQEGYFEEALKMRSLLQEFLKVDDPPTTIVGFREHIFTGSVSSLANYMALQELSFVTLGQRVLNRPLRVRMHYGHPDLFDKVFFMTRGGVSKASRGINLSEDIFAGYNNCIRGGQVTFKEYVQVGKGRDVGMQQIYKFEAKLSQGAAEQSLSRDVNRLGLRLDFFRLMSFYFGGLGYYIGNYITVLTITFVVYFMQALAVFDCERIGKRKITPEGTLQMLLAGMGVLNTLPMLATIMVEKGMRASLAEVLQVFISGGPMYFMFHIQTRAHYFYMTLLAGGAQYRATGRGFVTHHSTFDDLYRFFANSHFYLGFELATALIITGVFSHAKQYLGRTWSLWLACVSFIFAPFWFNPLSFEWSKVTDDYKRWMRWMNGGGGGSSNSWEVWWREENGYLAKFRLGQKLQCLVKPVIHVIIGLGMVLPKVMKMTPHAIKGATKAAIACTALLFFYYIVERFGHSMSAVVRRTSKLLISGTLLLGCGALLIAHPAYIKVVVGLYYCAAAVSCVGVVLGFHSVRYAYRLHDLLLGHVMFTVLFIFSALQIPGTVQTWLLFHNALSQGVVVEDILKYARKTQENRNNDAGEDDIVELRARLKHQEFLLAQFISGGPLPAGITANGGVGPSRGIKSASGTVVATVLEDEDMNSDVDSSGSGGTASMMRASNSTLNLSAMAHGGSSGLRQQQGGGAAASGPGGTFQFSGPSQFPPRDR